MLLLHAITSADASVEGSTGLRGNRLRRIDDGALSALATEFDQLVHLGKADLTANHALLLRLEDCLPVRFPTWLESEDEVRDHLRRRRDQLVEALQRVRGMCELAVTLSWAAEAGMPATVTTADSPGTRYLVERRRAYAQSEQELKRARELRDLVDSLSAQHGGQAEHRLCPGAGVALSSAVLIPRRDSVEVRTRLTEVLGRQHGVRILVHGPWPPYTFVGQKGWAGALKRGGVEA